MCRNIKSLFNFDPPVTPEEIRAASPQFVRKISGFNKPSKANEAAFLMAVDEIAAVSGRLIRSLETNALPRNREQEATRSEEHTSELQSRPHLVCRLLLEKKKKKKARQAMIRMERVTEKPHPSAD